jgi:hypothetical protein
MTAKLCSNCSCPAGPRSKRYCDYHAGYNAGYAQRFMHEKRAADPDYRRREKAKLKIRMRRLRAKPGYVRPENRVTA